MNCNKSQTDWQNMLLTKYEKQNQESEKKDKKYQQQHNYYNEQTEKHKLCKWPTLHGASQAS